VVGKKKHPMVGTVVDVETVDTKGTRYAQVAFPEAIQRWYPAWQLVPTFWTWVNNSRHFKFSFQILMKDLFRKKPIDKNPQ
jgi:hypothetical protein